MILDLKPKIWSIGHSVHSFPYFLQELETYGIKVLVDVRRLPGSNRYPHFNQEYLIEHLPIHGIEYVRIPELAGRRRQRTDSPHTVWRNPSFRAYADYMDTPEFMEGIRRLEQIALKHATAMMCAESVWWRCHRSMIADYLKSTGWTVIHIMSADSSTEHPYTSAASIVDGNLYYGASSESDK